MNSENFAEKFKQFIAEDKTEKAIELALIFYASKNKDKHNCFILLMSRYKQLHHENSIGTLPTQDYIYGLTKIKSDALKHVSDIPTDTEVASVSSNPESVTSNRSCFGTLISIITLLGGFYFLFYLARTCLRPSAPNFTYELVKVDGGGYQMGNSTDTKGQLDELTSDSIIYIPTFFIGKYEVTQKQWIDNMGYLPEDLSRCDSCPITNVSWKETQIFIDKVSTGSIGYRLPMEWEWEFAAKGGINYTDDNYVFAGSNDHNEVTWCVENTNQIQKIGKKMPNQLGIYDLSGNAREWCQNEYFRYPGGESPLKIEPGTMVNRGGSFADRPQKCRVSFRGTAENIDKKDIRIGFRLVAYSKQSSL